MAFSVTLTPLDQALGELLKAMPWTDSGQKLVYRHLIQVASAFHIRRRTFGEFERWALDNFTRETCGRRPQGNDLASSWNFVTHQNVSSSGGDSVSGGGWPDASPSRVERIVSGMSGVGVRSIRDGKRNQVARFDQWGILQRLFYPKALVCAGEDFYTPVTRSLEFFNDPALFARQQFVVANPMTRRAGKTKTGKASIRCADCACRPENQRFQVIEFDFKKLSDNGAPTIWRDTMERWESDGVSIKDAQARLIGYLMEKHSVPLCMVVDTAGKSLHGWFNVRDMDQRALREFKRDAAELGADTLLFRLEQWCRFPGGTRRNDNGTTARQEVLYFNPDACPPLQKETARGDQTSSG